MRLGIWNEDIEEVLRVEGAVWKIGEREREQGKRYVCFCGGCGYKMRWIWLLHIPCLASVKNGKVTFHHHFRQVGKTVVRTWVF